MVGWRRYLAIAFFPLNLCGVMSVVASAQAPMTADRRWALLTIGMLLSAPGVILMLLTIPLHAGDAEEEDEAEELAPPVSGLTSYVDDRRRRSDSWMADEA